MNNFWYFSTDTRKLGLCVIIDAQRTSWRTTRIILHHVTEVFRTELTTIIILRPEVFWDKQKVENCAKLKHHNGVSIYGDILEQISWSWTNSVRNLNTLWLRVVWNYWYIVRKLNTNVFKFLYQFLMLVYLLAAYLYTIVAPS